MNGSGNTAGREALSVVTGGRVSNARRQTPYGTRCCPKPAVALDTCFRGAYPPPMAPSYDVIPELVGVATYDSAVRVGSSVAENVRRLLRYHETERRLMQTFVADLPPMPIWEDETSEFVVRLTPKLSRAGSLRQGDTIKRSRCGSRAQQECSERPSAATMSPGERPHQESNAKEVVRSSEPARSGVIPYSAHQVHTRHSRASARQVEIELLANVWDDRERERLQHLITPLQYDITLNGMSCAHSRLRGSCRRLAPRSPAGGRHETGNRRPVARATARATRCGQARRVQRFVRRLPARTMPLLAVRHGCEINVRLSTPAVGSPRPPRTTYTVYDAPNVSFSPLPHTKAPGGLVSTPMGGPMPVAGANACHSGNVSPSPAMATVIDATPHPGSHSIIGCEPRRTDTDTASVHRSGLVGPENAHASPHQSVAARTTVAGRGRFIQGLSRRRALCNRLALQHTCGRRSHMGKPPTGHHG